MRKTLQLLAALVAVATVTVWLATGTNRGWTKTSVERTKLDEITGIDEITYEKRFVPGVEVVALGLFGAGVLAGVSFLFRRRNQTQT
jgi:hypothetical protein